MARIRAAAILATIEGSFGSAVMSVKKDRSGTMRERVTPANPKTAKQQNVRGAFKTSAKSFAAMPGVDALAWDAYGATQRSKTGKPLSGIGAYNRNAIVFRLISPGMTAPVIPPTGEYLGDGFAVSATAGANKVAFVGAGSTNPNSVVECLLQRLPAGNSKPTFNGYKTVAYATFDEGNKNTFTASVPPGRYAAAFRFCDKVTGQQTDLVQLSVMGVTLEVVQGGEDEKPAVRKKAA